MRSDRAERVGGLRVYEPASLQCNKSKETNRYHAAEPVRHVAAVRKARGEDSVLADRHAETSVFDGVGDEIDDRVDEG